MLPSIACDGYTFFTAMAAGALTVYTKADTLLGQVGAPTWAHWTLAGVIVDVGCRKTFNLDQTMYCLAAAGFAGGAAFRAYGANIPKVF